jgi:Cell morphogenesis N-terminal
MDALEVSTEFLQICAEYFQNARGSIKYAYVDLFNNLLEPLAAVSLRFYRRISYLRYLKLNLCLSGDYGRSKFANVGKND